MQASSRYQPEEIAAFANEVRKDGFCILRNHFDPKLIAEWNSAFIPLLEEHIRREGKLKNRGANRYYVTLPFADRWADPKIYEDADVLAVCEDLVGKDMVMVQLATDTPLLGSEYQEIHRDAPPLFPEWELETPSFQLAVNFPLVDVTLENGPFEVIRGTHQMTKEDGMRELEAGNMKIEPVLLKAGDVMVRDVRGLHRGTPNRTNEPRPMAVIGYSRKWLFRPEVQIQIPRAEYAKLSDKAKQMLRYNPVVESLENLPKTEGYQNFAY